MRKYQYHPDGWLILANGEAEYMDTPTNAALDSGLEVPALPAGAASVLYLEGRYNAAFNSDGDQYGGDDTLIPAYTALIDAAADMAAAQAQREAAAEQAASA